MAGRGECTVADLHCVRQKSKAASDNEDEEEGEQNDEEEKPAKKHPKSKYISEAQIAAMDAAAEAASSKALPQLKEILRKNGQKVGGTKSELVQRISECSVLGSVPLCQECGGGKLNFDLATCKYRCPGYMDDTYFVRCNGSFDFASVQRLAWVD
jgi:hypothetical protein